MTPPNEMHRETAAISTSQISQNFISSWTGRVALSSVLGVAMFVAMCSGCPAGPGTEPDGGGDTFYDNTVERLAVESDYTAMSSVGPQ